jgi:hypothetical protein
LSVAVSFSNGLEKGDALSPLLLNLSLEYVIRKVQENEDGMKLNEIYQLLIYANDINTFGEDINFIQKKTEALVEASNKIGLKVKAEKTQYVFIPLHQMQDIITIY